MTKQPPMHNAQRRHSRCQDNLLRVTAPNHLFFSSRTTLRSSLCCSSFSATFIRQTIAEVSDSDSDSDTATASRRQRRVSRSRFCCAMPAGGAKMSRLPCTAPVAGQTVPGETENGIGGCTTAGNRRLDSRAVEQAIDARIAEKEVERECRLPTSRLRVLDEDSLWVCVVVVTHNLTCTGIQDQKIRRRVARQSCRSFSFHFRGCGLRAAPCDCLSAVHECTAQTPTGLLRRTGHPVGRAGRPAPCLVSLDCRNRTSSTLDTRHKICHKVFFSVQAVTGPAAVPQVCKL